MFSIVCKCSFYFYSIERLIEKENLSGTNTLFKEKEIFFDLTNRYTNQPIRKENIDGSPYLLMQFLSKNIFLNISCDTFVDDSFIHTSSNQFFSGSTKVANC